MEKFRPQCAPLTKDEATLSYSRIYIPSLRYGLGTCHFTPGDLQRIQRPAVNVVLPKMGYNRHLPRPVVYGPTCLGAVGLPCLIFEQGLQQLQFLGRHLRSPTCPLRSLFQLGVEWFRLLSGYTVCPLSYPYLKTQHVELAPWFRSLQSFLVTINHSLEIPNLYLPRLLRENDKAIMTLPQAEFTATELLAINRCRLFLRVTTLLEISTADGLNIHSDVWRGYPPPHSLSKILWPRQHRQPNPSWRVWRRFLQQALRPGDYSGYSTRLPLRQPLGRWFSHYTSDRHWFWSYSARTSTLFRYDRLANSFQVHPSEIASTRIFTDIDPESCCDSIPRDAVPCEPRIFKDTVSLQARLAVYPPIPSPTPQAPVCPYTFELFPHPVAANTRPPHIPSQWSNLPKHIQPWESTLLPAELPNDVIIFLRTAHTRQITIHHCSDGSSQDN